MEGKVRVKHIHEGWDLTVVADKVLWRGYDEYCHPACYPKTDGVSLPLVAGERARLVENELGLMVVEVCRD